MKLKTVLLLLIVLVIIPEILLVTYVVSKYTLHVELPQIYTESLVSFVWFLLTNPLFLIITIVIIIVMVILYFALQTK